MTPETSAAIQAAAAVAAVIVTVILAVITAYYAWATRGMLTEMRHARERAEGPNVIAYAEPGEHGPTLVVRNIGGSSAFRISIVNRGPNPLPITMENRSVEVGERVIDGLFLAPGQSLITRAGITTMGSRATDLPPADIDCTWEDVDGKAGGSRSVVAFGSVMFAVYPGSLSQLHESLRDVSNELRQRRY